MPDQAWSCPWPSHQACPWSCPCGWEACSRRPSGPEWTAVAAWLPKRGTADALAAWPGPKGLRPLDSLGGTSKHTTTTTYLCTASCTQARVLLAQRRPVLTPSQVGRRTGTTRRRACRSGNRRPLQIGVGIESARARGRARAGLLVLAAPHWAMLPARSHLARWYYCCPAWSNLDPPPFPSPYLLGGRSSEPALAVRY